MRLWSPDDDPATVCDERLPGIGALITAGAGLCCRIAGRTAVATRVLATGCQNAHEQDEADDGNRIVSAPRFVTKHCSPPTEKITSKRPEWKSAVLCFRKLLFVVQGTKLFN